jgi:hypothetical protein
MQTDYYEGGTWIREPDGATLLMYSPHLYYDPPTALRNRKDEFIRAEYDQLPVGVLRPHNVHLLKPGEWIRIH